jgi:adenine deaminase
VARGEAAPDLVLKGGRVINVFSGEIIEADVALCEGIIAGVGSYDGPEEIDCRGCSISPGFIDGHFHIESSMLAPPELAKAVLPHGTTAIVADPHEIANVLGPLGIRYILHSGSDLPVDFFLMAPSCVPATHLETSGSELSAADLAPFRDEKRVLGLGEMMNYPGVLSSAGAVLEKIILFCDTIKDGHAPLVSGRDLQAYIAAGIRSDHESTGIEEAREKLRSGMHVMIREGTQAKNLRELLPLVSPITVRQCSLVTDDLHPHELIDRGHLDHLIDLATGEGLDPVLAIMMVSHSTARYFGLTNRGAIAPGYEADILILSSLKPLRVQSVFKRGRWVYEKGSLIAPFPASREANEEFSPMKVKLGGKESFTIPQGGSTIRVIGLVPDQIITECLIVEAPVKNGVVVADVGRDLLKVAVAERHRGTGNVGLGMVRGFGLRYGAIASSVAHDSHNIICVGCNDGDMEVAVKAVVAMHGGMVAVRQGEVMAALPLPLAGLMSDRSLEDVCLGWEAVRQAASALGCHLAQPFMALSFLALPVIPELKITDRGLVDVNLFTHVPLFVS